MKELGYKVEYFKSNIIKKLYLELTDDCNLNCSMCYRKSWDSKPNEMEWNTFLKVLKDIKNIEGLEIIVLGGIGEPTYYSEIIEVLEKLKEYNIHITTNGTLFTEELIRKMIETVNTVTISIDGVENKFKEIRGVDLNLIIENINKLQNLKKKLNSSYPKVQLQFVMSKENIDDIYNVMDLASDLKSDFMIVSNLIPQDIDSKDTILYDLYPNGEVKSIIDKINRYSFKKGLNLHIPDTHLNSERSCNFIEDISTFITSKGDIVPCYRLSHNYKEYLFGREKKVSRHSFGNINDDSLLEIWNSHNYSKFRYTIHNNLYPSCMDCNFVEGCDYPKYTYEDCYSNTPSCADCLWNRKFVYCP